MATPDFSARHTLDVEHRGRMLSMSCGIDQLREVAAQPTGTGPGPVADRFVSPDIAVRLAARNAEASRRSEAQKLARASDELKYVLNAGPVLLKYYDMQRDADDASRPCHGPVKDSILKYFIPKTCDTTQSDGVKTQLMKEYERAARGDTLDVDDDAAEATVCSACGAVDKTIVVSGEALALCTNCDACEQIVIETERPPSKDTVKDSSAFCYKRLNHFNEWLSQIQGKQQTNIPDDVYDGILLELKKRQVVNLSEVTNAQVKDILKKLKLARWYEHVTYIRNKLTGSSFQMFHPALEEELRTMFKQIQGPFSRHAPSTRRNFLSYSLVLSKMLELLGEDQYLDCFQQLKSREKLALSDTVWKAICGELNWEFIPSV